MAEADNDTVPIGDIYTMQTQALSQTLAYDLKPTQEPDENKKENDEETQVMVESIGETVPIVMEGEDHGLDRQKNSIVSPSQPPDFGPEDGDRRLANRGQGEALEQKFEDERTMKSTSSASINRKRKLPAWMSVSSSTENLSANSKGKKAQKPSTSKKARQAKPDGSNDTTKSEGIQNSPRDKILTEKSPVRILRQRSSDSKQIFPAKEANNTKSSSEPKHSTPKGASSRSSQKTEVTPSKSKPQSISKDPASDSTPSPLRRGRSGAKVSIEKDAEKSPIRILEKSKKHESKNKSNDITPVKHASSDQFGDTPGTSKKVNEDTPNTDKKQRKSCQYGEKCYKKSRNHRDEFSHPGDSDWESESEEGKDDDRPECEYGTDCYRKNPRHTKEYKHTRPAMRQAAKKAAASVLDDDEDDDGGPNTYDRNDSFLDDSNDSQDLADSGNEDSDFVPSDDDGGAQDDQDKEVEDLQSEAKEFIKNKKMHKPTK